MSATRYAATLVVLTLCTLGARADDPKPVTLEIISGDARPITVTNATTRHPFTGAGGWPGTASIDGLTFSLGKTEITVAWNRIKSVTIGERSIQDGRQAVKLELQSGEKQELHFDDTRDYIEGETSLGKCKVYIRDIKSIKTVAQAAADQKLPGTKP